ncbi:MAG: heme-binding protein [Candidatus Thiodiazotropha sp.]
MKYLIRITTTALLILIGANQAMAIEEAKYEVIKKDNEFEIRDYASHILAETVVQGKMEEAGKEAFQLLFHYISGGNQSRKKVAMTAPVSQQPMGEKIKMTSPVGQRRVEQGWVISFMMPASYTLETLPQPDDPKVTLRQVPARRMAAVRYTGFWSEKSYMQHRLALESWIHKTDLTIKGDPIWARYNSPFTPWFMRRNEVLIPIDADTALEVQSSPAGNNYKGHSSDTY